MFNNSVLLFNYWYFCCCTELYVFGMGDDVNAEDINDLKTDRGNEKFFFKLKSIEQLQETFDNMIGTSFCLFSI